MSAITYSSGLQEVIRSLKQMDGKELENLFKNANWFESRFISAKEGKMVSDLFIQSKRTSVLKSNTEEVWV